MDLAGATLHPYAETAGGIYALAFARESIATTTGALGVRADALLKLAGLNWLPRARVELQHDFQSAAHADITYADSPAGQVYRAGGDAFAHDRVRVQLGAQVQLNSQMRFAFDYDASVADGESSRGGRIELTWRF